MKTPTRIVLFAAFVLITITSFGQKGKLDSLYSALENHPREDTIRVKMLTAICHMEYTSDNEKNKLHAEEALRIAKSLNYKNGIGTALKYTALYYWVRGEYEMATQYGIEMLKVFEGSTNLHGLSQAYNLLGLINERARNYNQAKRYYLSALEVRQKAGLKRDVGYSYNSLGSLYHSLTQNDSALIYFLKSLEIRQEIGDEDGLSQTYGNLAVIYTAQKDYDKALKYYEMALGILEKSNNKYRLAVNYTNLGEVYIYTKRYDRAEYYLLKSVAMAKAMHHKEVLTETYNKLTLLENARGRYQQAFQYLELRHAYEDSLYTEKKAKQIAEIETRYETEKKDKAILAFLQQKQLQDLKQTYLIIGFISVIVAFVIIYWLQRSYNRKARTFLATQRILNTKLQENDRLKSRFFANISHEFRTPLSLILSPIEEKLSSTELSSRDQSTFQLVKRNAYRLLSLVNQLLDLSKLEAGKMELRVQQGNLNQFLVVLSSAFDSLAETKKIHFIKDIHFDLSPAWYDADKLEKIVNNGLSNAFKFTPQDGTITLSIHTGESRDLKIGITDTGKGIPKEEQQYLFSPFYQSRHSADDASGTGLGLALVKELVKVYNGSIELTSEPGLGTTLSVTLPTDRTQFPDGVLIETPSFTLKEIDAFNLDAYAIHQGDQLEKVENESETSDNHVILVVEDNADLRNYISSVLNDQFIVITASDGEEGLALATEHIPDLIVSDVMMPKLNGIDLTSKIKLDERTSHIPVVLLTAKADLDSRLEGFRTGADDYLAKPFANEELLVRINNLIEQREKLVLKYKAGLSEPPQPKKELSMDEKFIQKAREIVDVHMSDANFGVEQMAEEMNLSRTQLFRKLKAILQLSPNQFINDLRLQKAAMLIKAKSDTLTQISYSVGFNEQSYFAKRFRRKYGVAPSEYSAN